MNKKGMTLVELLVTFSLLLVIIVGIYNLILSVKANYEEKDITKSLTEYSAMVSNEIQYDLLKNKPKTINVNETSSGFLITADSKTIELITDGEIGVKYGGVFEPVPNSKFVELERGDNKPSVSSDDNGCLVINFPIYSVQSDDPENYGFKVVYPYKDVDEEQIEGTSSYTVTLSVQNGNADNNGFSALEKETATTTVTANPGYNQNNPEIKCDNNQRGELTGTTFKINSLESDTECTITFKPFTYNVIYNANGGTGSMEKSSFTYGSSNTLSSNAFTRNGYTFIGWSESSSGEIEYNDGASILYTPKNDGENYNLYALWNKSSYKVVLNVINGKGSPSEKDVDVNTSTSFDISPNDGYGSGEANCTNNVVARIDGNSLIIDSVNADTVCTVTYKVSDYTIKYDSNGGSGTMEDSIFEYDSDSKLRKNTFTKEGYTFAGWSTSLGGEVKYTDEASVRGLSKGGVVTLYAVWNINKYKVSVNVINGTSDVKERLVDYNTSTAFKITPNTGYGLPTVSCTNGISASISNDSLVTGNITSDTICTVTYKVSNYTVKYDNNGGTGTMEDSIFQYDSDSKLRKNTFTKEGYTFAGWSTSLGGKVKYTDEASVRNLSTGGTITLYAVWNINKYKVSVNVINGTSDAKEKIVEHNTSTAFKITPNTGYGLPTVSCTNGISASISNDSLVTGNITSDTVCTVTYKANNYTVKYDNNGGSGNMEDSIFQYDSSYTLRKNTFTRAGYTFKGWSTSQSGEVKYTDEASVRNLSTGGTVTLYAVWERNKVSYEIRYNANGGEILDKLDLAIVSADDEWTYNNGIYMSNNHTNSSSSSVRSTKFTLNNAGKISFDVAVSSGYGDYLYYSIYDANDNLVSGTGTSAKFSGFLESDTFDNLEFVNVTKELSSGTYVLEFTYYKDDVVSQGLDSGYVKNIYITSNNQKMSNTSHKSGEAKKLARNLYSSVHKSFAGWSTSSNGEVKYSDMEEVVDLTWEADSIVDLYAIWEINKYKVNVVVQNGVVDGDSLANVTYNTNHDFKLIPNDTNALGAVKCSNHQTGTFNPDTNILTINNVSSDTTCVVTLRSVGTTLFNDGTLIINEQAKDRNNNIQEHGKVISDYEPFSSDNSYVFDLVSHVVSSGNVLVSNAPWSSYLGNDTIKKVLIGSVIKPIDTSNWFYKCFNMENGDFSNLDTSTTTKMSNMFSYSGKNSTSYTLTGLDKWNLSNAIDMSYMFKEAGINASNFKIDNLSSWDVSNNPDMSYIFANAGEKASSWNIGNLSNWDTSNWSSMKALFSGINLKNGVFDVGDLSNWNTKKVTNMSYLFNNSNIYTITKGINFINTWGTSNVTNMSSMFRNTGNGDTYFVIDLSKFDTSNVTDMSYIFDGIALSARTLTVTGLDNWNVSNVHNMEGAFRYSGWNAKSWNMGNLSSWNTKNVTNMKSMFEQSGMLGPVIWSMGDLSSWDTSNVTNMNSCFKETATSVVTFDLGNLSSWNTSKVEDMNSMFRRAGEYAINWNAGDLSSWNTSNVKDMSYLFYYIARNADSLSIGSLDNWNTSSVTNMSYMFTNMGPIAKNWAIGDLSSWNVSNVTNMRYMFSETGFNSDAWSIGSLDKWDTSNVKDMSYMFEYAGRKTLKFNSIGTIKIPSSCNVDYFASSSGKFTGNIVFEGTVRNAGSMFGEDTSSYSVIDSDSKVNLYYTNNFGASAVDYIIAYKNSNQNIYKLGIYEG
ncbi:MAG: BspA family leucine-rich repeat surface protein [bacterium]|nr:BspA family leucine-rich repeat surface protein [bacterium]